MLPKIMPLKITLVKITLAKNNDGEKYSAATQWR